MHAHSLLFFSLLQRVGLCQLALAPVFLLTGIAGLLNVVAGRLARIIDRGRSLTEQELPQHLQDHPDIFQKELSRLARRYQYASQAITASTCSAFGADSGCNALRFSALQPIHS